MRGYMNTKDKEELVKALMEEGHRESALLLKNWGEMDANAERLSKAMSPNRWKHQASGSDMRAYDTIRDNVPPKPQKVLDPKTGGSKLKDPEGYKKKGLARIKRKIENDKWRTSKD